MDISKAFEQLMAHNEQVSTTVEQIDTVAPGDPIDYLPQGSREIRITRSGAIIPYTLLIENIEEELDEEFSADNPSHMKILQTKIKRIKNHFILRYKLFTGYEHRIARYLQANTANDMRVVVPRFGIYEILDQKHGLQNCYTRNYMQLGERPSKPFAWEGKLNTNQTTIYNHLKETYFSKDHLRSGSSGCILNLMAGQGKSYLASYMIHDLQYKTAIILPLTSLHSQWKKVLHETLGQEVSIGSYYSKEKTDGDIVLLVIDSACKTEFLVENKKISALDYFRRFGLIIYDECHMYASKFKGSAFYHAQAPYVLGLSATPDQNIMKFDKLVWWELGPICDAQKINGVEHRSTEWKAVVHQMSYKAPDSYAKHIVNDITGMVDVQNTITMLCSDEYRTRLVIRCIIQCLENKCHTYVFADRRSYLEILQKKLIEELQNKVRTKILCEADTQTCAKIVGGATEEQLESATNEAQVIFTTYHYMGTGKSIPKMNGLVLATPRKSKMDQYIMRIFRLGSDEKKVRHIYDIHDVRCALQSQWNVRLKFYKKHKFNIVRSVVNYKDFIKKTTLDVEDIHVDLSKAISIANKINKKLAK